METEKNCATCQKLPCYKFTQLIIDRYTEHSSEGLHDWLKETSDRISGDCKEWEPYTGD